MPQLKEIPILNYIKVGFIWIWIYVGFPSSKGIYADFVFYVILLGIFRDFVLYVTLESINGSNLNLIAEFF